jgi:hypothetical protein
MKCLTPKCMHKMTDTIMLNNKISDAKMSNNKMSNS